MPAFSNFAENELLDAATGTGSYVNAAPHLSLHDDIPGETGANEVTGGSYARQVTAFDAAAAGAAALTAQEEFTSMPAVTVTHVGLWDALTVGNFIAWFVLGTGIRHFFTAADTGDLFTAPGHGRSNDDRIQLVATIGGTLPTGTDETTIYYVIGATTDTYQLSLTSGGAAVALTSDGSGLALLVDLKVVNSGDTFRIPAGQATLSLD